MKRTDPLLRAVSSQLRLHLPEGTRHLVCGLSGGADSVCLLFALHTLREEHGCTLSAAHLNHLLRGQAAFDDEQFVRELCERWEIPLLVERCDVRTLAQELRCGEEQAGRQARYALFARACTAYPHAVAATAHTASDQAETVLLSLFRGSGLDGLSGIPPAREGVIRPLLSCTRDEVERFCSRHGLSYVTDQSNLEPVYTRNKIRLELLPELSRDYNPNLVRTLTRTASLLREETALLNRMADALPPPEADEAGRLIFDRALLRQYEPALTRRYLRRRIEAVFSRSLSAERSQALLALALGSGSSRLAELPGHLTALVEGNRLLLFSTEAPAPQLSLSSLCMGENKLPGFGILWISRDSGEFFCKDATIHRLRCDIIPDVLSLRTRRPKDRYRPVGRPEKLLSDLFIDARIARGARELAPVVTLGKAIVSCFPFGPSQDAAAKEGQPALVLRYEPHAALRPLFSLPQERPLQAPSFSELEEQEQEPFL